MVMITWQSEQWKISHQASNQQLKAQELGSRGGVSSPQHTLLRQLHLGQGEVGKGQQACGPFH